MAGNYSLIKSAHLSAIADACRAKRETPNATYTPSELEEVAVELLSYELADAAIVQAIGWESTRYKQDVDLTANAFKNPANSNNPWIRSYAFYNVNGFKAGDTYRFRSVEIPEWIVGIGTRAFYTCLLPGGLSIPGDDSTPALYLMDEAFHSCSSFTSLRTQRLLYPYGTAKGIFYNCSSMTELDAPMKSVPENCFYGCSKLKTARISGDCASIGANAFYNCNALESVTIDVSQRVVPIASNSFSSSSCIFYVPADKVEDYKSATNWAQYASRIRAIE